MSANPHLPTTINFKRKALSATSFSTAFSPTQIAAMQNQLPLMLPKYRAALGKVRQGTGNCRVLCIGDSIISGAYSNGSTGAGDWKQANWVNLLAKTMNAGLSTPAFSDSFMGFSDVTHDSRIISTGWSQGVSDPTIGGPYLLTSASNTLSYTPSNPVDTFKIWYLTIVSAGVLNYNVNGGPNSTVNQNSATSFASVTISTGRGTNTLNMSHASGGNVFVCGIEAWDSTTNSVQFINAGFDSATTSSWNNKTSAYSAGNFATLGCDLTIISLGVNDMLPVNGPVSPSVTYSNLQSFITSALTTGDCMFVTENPGEVASTVPLAAQKQYWDVVKSLANTNNIPLVNIFDRWKSYEFSNPLGYYTAGAAFFNLHPSPLGYSDYARAVFNVLRSV